MEIQKFDLAVAVILCYVEIVAMTSFLEPSNSNTTTTMADSEQEVTFKWLKEDDQCPEQVIEYAYNFTLTVYVFKELSKYHPNVNIYHKNYNFTSPPVHLYCTVDLVNCNLPQLRLKCVCRVHYNFMWKRATIRFLIDVVIPSRNWETKTAFFAEMPNRDLSKPSVYSKEFHYSLSQRAPIQSLNINDNPINIKSHSIELFLTAAEPISVSYSALYLLKPYTLTVMAIQRDGHGHENEVDENDYMYPEKDVDEDFLEPGRSHGYVQSFMNEQVKYNFFLRVTQLELVVSYSENSVRCRRWEKIKMSIHLKSNRNKANQAPVETEAPKAWLLTMALALASAPSFLQ